MKLTEPQLFFLALVGKRDISASELEAMGARLGFAAPHEDCRCPECRTARTRCKILHWALAYGRAQKGRT